MIAAVVRLGIAFLGLTVLLVAVPSLAPHTVAIILGILVLGTAVGRELLFLCIKIALLPLILVGFILAFDGFKRN